MSHRTTKWPVHPAKTQISLGICPVWSESSLCAKWVAKLRALGFFKRTAKTLIRLGGYPGWSESSLAHILFLGFVMRHSNPFCQETFLIISQLQFLSLRRYYIQLFKAILYHFHLQRPHKKKDLCIAQLVILQMFMRSHQVGLSVCLILCTNSKDSSETAGMCRLAWAFAICQCDQYPFHMGWLK